MPAHSENEFLSCDWGTSSFRLRWVCNGAILREHADSTGCRAIFDAHPPDSRPAAFADHLRSSLSKLVDSTIPPMPLVISGMASSTIGWMELPYAKLPLRLDASNLHLQKIRWNAPAAVTETYLVSGAASETEMMRGEETEAIGLLRMLPSLPSPATLNLPGTHSKHLRLENGAITAIQTFMTGELYDVLTRHSVLRASVSSTPANFDPAAFAEGIDHTIAHGLAASLFQTRTRQVLGRQALVSNASFLSGLLIGSELLTLKSAENLLIAGADSVRNLYAEAAKLLGLAPSHVFSAEEVQLAVPRAHHLLLTRLQK